MTPQINRILIIDKDEEALLEAKIFLQKHIRKIDITQNPNKIPFFLNNASYDVILLDINFSEDRADSLIGFHWLEEILKIDPKAVVIMITAHGDIETAVNALKAGATDFVLKPWRPPKMLATLLTAAKLKASYDELKRLRKTQAPLSTDASQYGMIGESKSMESVKKIINKVAVTDANVLILGENGTGKELVAKAIHKISHLSNKVFVGVDMGAISETLFESELFGHKKGSFTDAKEDRVGRFEVASGGTLFLDEIGNLPLTHQAKLLAVLQNREVLPVGSNKVIPIDVRLVCATNMPLYEMVPKGTFRQDLLYRINTVEIQLPPLRQRLEDIPILAKHFVNVYAQKYNTEAYPITETSLEKLLNHPWPGNIRELQHAIERAVIMNESLTLDPDDFDLKKPASKLSPTPSDEETLEEEEVQPIRPNKLNALEKVTIQKALKKHQGNITRAAKDLGLSRASLYRRIEKYGI